MNLYLNIILTIYNFLLTKSYLFFLKILFILFTFAKVLFIISFYDFMKIKLKNCLIYFYLFKYKVKEKAYECVENAYWLPIVMGFLGVLIGMFTLNEKPNEKSLLQDYNFFSKLLIYILMSVAFILISFCFVYIYLLLKYFFFSLNSNT